MGNSLPAGPIQQPDFRQTAFGFGVFALKMCAMLLVAVGFDRHRHRGDHNPDRAQQAQNSHNEILLCRVP
jgi:hypothetical protein